MAGLGRFRPSPALVVASIALLVALGGTGYAAVSATAPANSVNTAALQNGAVTDSKIHGSAVTNPKIASNAVTSGKVKNGTLLKADFAAGQIPPGPPGPAGPAGPAGAAGAAGASGNNSLVAFANVNGTGASPSIRSFGGQGTTGASVITCGTGCFDVTFTGSFPHATSKDAISSFATADTDNYDWASTSLNASPVPTTSSITIRCWTLTGSTSPASVVNRDFAVEVLVP
jgi:hypothetical protein